MALLKEYLLAERQKILDQNIRFTVIVRRSGLPDEVLAEIDETCDSRRTNTGLTLCLAINYGSRAEIVDAVQAPRGAYPARRFEPRGHRRAGDFGFALHTAGMPDPDLLVRTAGEMRVSNYLLWQSPTPNCG